MPIVARAFCQGNENKSVEEGYSRSLTIWLFSSKIFVSLLFTKTRLVFAFECITASRYISRADGAIRFFLVENEKDFDKLVLSKNELHHFMSLPSSCRVYSIAAIKKKTDGNFV